MICKGTWQKSQQLQVVEILKRVSVDRGIFNFNLYVTLELFFTLRKLKFVHKKSGQKPVMQAPT